jgi:DNA ligase-1
MVPGPPICYCWPMTRLADLVGTSERVGATRARLAKVRELAELLRTLGPDEIRIGVQYLAGEAPQGRFGIGPSVLRAAATAPPADAPSLTLTEVDKTLTEVAALRGCATCSGGRPGPSRTSCPGSYSASSARARSRG